MPVEDPSAYGLVRRNGDGSVSEFLEKPSPDQIDTNLINAGAYVLERDVLDLMPPGAARLDRARGLPALVGDGLYGYARDGYWLDIGTPERYLQATLRHPRRRASRRASPTPTTPRTWRSPTARE